MSLLRTTFTVAKRELTESLRDAMTLAFTFGFPLVFYPLLILGSLQLASLEDSLASRRNTRMVVSVPADVLAALDAEDLDVSEGDPVASERALLDGEVDQLLSSTTTGDALAVVGQFSSTRPRSSQRRDDVERALDSVEAARLLALEQSRGLEPGGLGPLEIVADDQAPAGRTFASLLGMLLPTMLLYTMGITGVYPVVEVVVGERERGTVETGMASGASRVALVAGKMVAVLALMLLSIAGNALSLLLTFWSLLEQTAPGTEVEVAVQGLVVLPALALVGVTGVLMAAAMTVAVLPAGSFRQAQSLASTVGVVLGFPALAGILPDLELTLATAAIPVTNATLVFRNALQEQMLDPALTAVALGVNGLLAVGLLVVAGRVISSEAWLFGGRVPVWLRWLNFGGTGD